MMVALMPEHVLQQEDWVVVVKVHGPRCDGPVLYRVPDCVGAFVQHLRYAARVRLRNPLLLRYGSGELGGVLEDEHKPYIVDMCEQLCNRWAALHCPDLQTPGGQRAQQVQ